MKFEYVGNLDYVAKQRDAVEAIAMMIIDRLDNVFSQHRYNWELEFDHISQEDARYEWTVFLVEKLNEWLSKYINIYLDNLFVIALPSTEHSYNLLFGFKHYRDCMFYTVWGKNDKTK